MEPSAFELLKHVTLCSHPRTTMAATFWQKVLAFVLCAQSLTKLIVYNLILLFAGFAIFDLVGSEDQLSRSGGYFMVSGLVYCRASIETQIAADMWGLEKSLHALMLEAGVLFEGDQLFVILAAAFGVLQNRLAFPFWS